MPTTVRNIFLLLIPAILLTGCNGLFGPEPEVVWSRVEVDDRLTLAYTDFGFDLFRELRAADPDGNVFVSPTSAAFALALAYNGAVGQTAEEMALALGIQGMTVEEVNRANEVWLGALADTQDPRAELAIANSIWHRPEWTPLPDFLDRTRAHYEAEVREMRSADEINAWVRERTRGRIDGIVEPPIPPHIVAYLINALYFKADWTHQFEVRATRDAPFTRPDGSTVTVPMMGQTRRFPVRHGSASEPFDMVRLPYGNGRFSMVLALPNRGVSLGEVATALGSAAWTRWMDGFGEQEISIGLPRLEVEWESSLQDALEALGMEIPFDEARADFTAMFGSEGIYIDDVLQKTYLRVDEEGTEAAAVTSVEMGLTSAPPSLIFDRPFFLAIYDHATETVLFLGQITDPTG